MLHFFESYLLFLSKIFTSFLLLFMFLLALKKSKEADLSPTLTITHWNKQLEEWEKTLLHTTLGWRQCKKHLKKKKALKSKDRLFIIDFSGDIQASAASELRDIISALLTTVTVQDEILIRLESKGGAVNAYGLAASQLARIRAQGIPLTVAVDHVAASGGYLMACIADKIIAAPFAIIGSIGVIMQVPNFYEWLKKHHIKVEEITAGSDKRHLTLFTENSKQDKEKAQEQAEDIHQIFKQYIIKYRPQVDLSQVDSGAYWLAETAQHLNLVDTISTSDSYLQTSCQNKEVYLVKKKVKKSKLGAIKSLFNQYCKAAEGLLK